MKKRVGALALGCVLALAAARDSQAAGEIRYQIEALAGTGVCLDIVNDAAKDKVTAAKCGKFTGQFWTVEPYGKLREGYVRLRTTFTGEKKCLDIVNDDARNKVVMAPCGNFTGQMWSIQMVGPDGLSQLRTKFTGATRCLQMMEGADRYSAVVMFDCDTRDTQQWRLNLLQ